LTKILKKTPDSNIMHHHNYHEYYLVLRGRGKLTVEGQTVPLKSETIVMVEPEERHRVSWVDPIEGIQWVIIKERSVPNSKFVLKEKGKKLKIRR